MSSKKIMAAGLLVALAVFLAGANLSPTVGGITVTPKIITADLPVDPEDTLWKSARQVAVPLSAVNIRDGIGQVYVKALANSEAVAFRLEWRDTTMNASSFAPQEFTDAAAVQLAAQYGTDICMGQLDRLAHIWYWRADKERGSNELSDRYPAAHSDDYQAVLDVIDTEPAVKVGNPMTRSSFNGAVEHLVAEGFSSLTTLPEQTATGASSWGDGKWSVVILIPVNEDEELREAFFTGGRVQAAFAVWDGQKLERDGMKSTTGWVNLQNPELVGFDWLLWTLVTVSAAIVGTVIWQKQKKLKGGDDNAGNKA